MTAGRNEVRLAPGGNAIAWHRPFPGDDRAWLVIEEDPDIGVEHTWHRDDHVADWPVMSSGTVAGAAERRPPGASAGTTD